MSFPSQDTQSVCFMVGWDPAGDDVIPVWRAPKACEVVRAQLTMPNAVNAGTVNYFSVALRNGGSDGSGTAQLGANIGGTAGWAALTPVPWTLTEGTLATGDVVEIVYDEEGSATIQGGVVQIDYVLGIGA